MSFCLNVEAVGVPIALGRGVLGGVLQQPQVG